MSEGEVSDNIKAEELEMKENQSYADKDIVSRHTTDNVAPQLKSTGGDGNRNIIIVLLVTFVLIAVVVAAACIAIAGVISNLKSETVHFNSADMMTMLDELNKSLQSLNSSQIKTDRQLQQLNLSLNLLMNNRFSSADLATRLEGLNNSVSALLTQLAQNIDSQIQQLNLSFDLHVNYGFNSNPLLTRLEGTNDTIDTIFTQLIQNYSEINSQFQQLNSSLSSQVDELANQTQQIFNNIGYPGTSRQLPATSCAAVFPFSPSGYYWVRSSNGSAVHVYCNMTMSCGNITGGWMKVAELDVTNTSHQCPIGFMEEINSYVRSCVSTFNSTGCSPNLVLSTAGVGYSKVCGKLNGFQIGNTNGFSGDEIDSNYVDGISVTHGSPRQYIWTFAAAYSSSRCHCSTNTYSYSRYSPPIGYDYFCDTGSNTYGEPGRFYPESLWDGVNCRRTDPCCNYNNPPWFFKQLSQLTADDIDIRVCRSGPSSVEDISIASFEFFVH